MQRELPRRVFFTVNAPVAERENLRAFAMAAALLGIPLKPRNDFVLTRRVENGKPVEHVAWFFHQKSPDGVYKTAELWQWWNDPEWLTANPSHPLAIYHEYWTALQDALAHERQAVPIAVITRGRRHAFIPLDLPADRKNKLLDLLEK